MMKAKDGAERPRPIIILVSIRNSGIPHAAKRLTGRNRNTGAVHVAGIVQTGRGLSRTSRILCNSSFIGSSSWFRIHVSI
jgi:hypothetical protein